MLPVQDDLYKNDCKGETGSRVFRMKEPLSFYGIYNEKAIFFQ